MYQRSRASWTQNIDFAVWDLLILQLSYVLAFFIRFPERGILPYFDTLYLDQILVLSLAQIVAGLILGSLNNVMHREFFAELISVAAMTLVMLSLISMYMYAMHIAGRYSRLLVYYTLVLYFVLDTAVRCVWRRVVLAYPNLLRRVSKKSLVIAGSLEQVLELVQGIRSEVVENYTLKGVVLPQIGETENVLGVPVVADFDTAADFIVHEWVDEVLIAQRERTGALRTLVKDCARMGVTVHSVIDLKNVERKKQFIEEIGGNTVLTTAYNYIAPYQAFFKRALDLVGGLVGSIFTILIGIVIGPIIYISSPGPILFRQKRIGKNGKVFHILKFRSMYLDAEERKQEYLAQNRVADGMMFKLDFDPRIIGNRILPDGTHKTGIGEFIRKTSLDEFPQFFNVLHGDMSLVGTRPPTLDEWEKYKYHHRARLAIKPGITGLWQVSGRSEITDFEKVVDLDTNYICNFRLSLDLKILLKTVFVLFGRKGAM